ARAEYVGLSWFVGTHRGNRTISHSGGDVGFRTHLVLLPDRSMALVVLTNVMPAPVEVVTEAALDVMLGFETPVPRPPVLVELKKTYLEKGLEAAVEQYHHFKETQPDAHDFGAEQFFYAGYLLVEMDSARQAVDTLKLGLVAHPESDGAFALLALAYMKSGDKELAIQNVKRALELNPENARATQMLKQLE
ncbi:MAG: serine hydrolase, partial [Candidatus Hodarchaeales archaeon]